jgi:hypothetical protein
MANPLDNYDFVDSVEVRANPNANISRFKWVNDWEMAYICNQMDDCPAFIKAKNNQAPVNGVTGGGYLRKGSSVSEQVSSTYWKSWMKKGSVRKVWEHKPNEPSVLETPVTKVSFFDGANFDGTEWKHGRGFVNGGGFPGEDRQGSIRVPLGYRFLGFEHLMNSDNSTNGAGNTISAVGPADLSMSQLQANGVLDNISSYIIEQIPFDVQANFFTMTSSGKIDPQDVQLIRRAYCTNISTIDSQECKLFSADPANMFDFDVVKTNLCNQNANWHTDPRCVSAINTAQKTGSQAGKDTATEMVRVLCEASPTNSLCGCYNVTKHGTQCIRDANLKNLPGCQGLFTDFGSLPSSYGAVDSDKFCSSDDCITKAYSGGSALLPRPRSASDTCPPIQKCIQDFRGASFDQSALDASCKLQLNISTGTTPPAAGTTPPAAGTTPPAAGTTPPAAGTTPPAAGSPPSGSPPPSSDEDTLWPADTIPGLDTKSKQIGLIVFIICCCCCLMIIAVAMMSGDGGGGSAGPNYSASLARLGAISSSL